MAFNNIPPNGFPALPDVEDLEAVVKDVNALKSSVSGLTEDVSDLNDNKANQITIAPFFNSETSYDVGDLVYYNGLSYRCTNAHEGEWDADDFAGTTVANELAEVKSGLMSAATDAQKNTDYVGDSYVKVLRIGKLVNVSGRFEVATEKPVGQEHYFFSGLPAPLGQIIPVYSDTNKSFIISVVGNLTSNGVVAAQFYNIDVTYSTT